MITTRTEPCPGYLCNGRLIKPHPMPTTMPVHVVCTGIDRHRYSITVLHPPAHLPRPGGLMAAVILQVTRTRYLIGPRWSWTVTDPMTGVGAGGWARTRRAAQRAALAADLGPADGRL